MNNLNAVSEITLTAIQNIPEINPGDEIASIINQCIEAQECSLKNNDVLVIAQKIISKSEDRFVDLKTVKPSEKALKISKEVDTFNNLMASVLESLQVTGIGEVGEDFDPSVHEAVEHTGEGESQKIEAVMRKGYLFQGNLIRPAMVKVKSE